MKTLLLIASLTLLCGCYSARQYPLQPGEKIIFNDAPRANEYRKQSGNDTSSTNRVVIVTRPCSLTTE